MADYIGSKYLLLFYGLMFISGASNQSTAPQNDVTSTTGSSVCSANELLCDNGVDCYDSQYKCDGVPDCPDDSDELHCPTLPPTCPEQQKRCPDGTCVYENVQCPSVFVETSYSTSYITVSSDITNSSSYFMQTDSLPIMTSLQKTVEKTFSTSETIAVSDLDSFMSESLKTSTKYISSEIVSDTKMTSTQDVLMTSSAMANVTATTDTPVSTQVLLDTLSRVFTTDVTVTAVVSMSLSDSYTSSTKLVFSSITAVQSSTDSISTAFTKNTSLSTISAVFSDLKPQISLPTSDVVSLSTSFVTQSTPFHDSVKLSSSAESVATSVMESISPLETSQPFTNTTTVTEMSSSASLSSSSFIISSKVESSLADFSTAIKSVDTSILSDKSSTVSDTHMFPTSSDGLISPTSSIRSVPDGAVSSSVTGSKSSTFHTQSLSDRTSASTHIMTSFPESSQLETTPSTRSSSSSKSIFYSSRTYTSLESQSSVMPSSTVVSLPSTIVTSLPTATVSSTPSTNQTSTQAPLTSEPFPGWLIAVIVCGSVVFLYFLALLFVMCKRPRQQSTYQLHYDDPDDIGYRRSLVKRTGNEYVSYDNRHVFNSFASLEPDYSNSSFDTPEPDYVMKSADSPEPDYDRNNSFNFISLKNSDFKGTDEISAP